MELGMIGLGRMGGNMAQRLIRAGHRVAAYDPRPEATQSLAAMRNQCGGHAVRPAPSQVEGKTG